MSLSDRATISNRGHRAESAWRLILNMKVAGSLSETKIGRAHRLKMSILPGTGRFWRAFFSNP